MRDKKGGDMKDIKPHEERLKKILLSDRMTANEGFYLALSRDLTALLSEYFEMDESSLAVDIESLHSVCYGVDISFRATRLKNIKVVQ